MANKIEKFLQDIHKLESKNINKKALEKQLQLLISTNPELVADDAFKHKLRTRLNNIIDYKSSNEQVKKIRYLKIIIPVLACFVFIIGIFSMIDMNFSDPKSKSIAPIVSEDATVIDTELSPEEIAQEIQQDEKKQKQKSIKEKILEKARLEKEAAKKDLSIEPLSDNEVFGEQSPAIVETILEDITAGDNVDGAGTQFDASLSTDTPEPLVIPEEPQAENDPELLDTSITDILDDSAATTIAVDALPANSPTDDAITEVADVEQPNNTFELFCNENSGTIIEAEEEPSCSFGEGKTCTQTQINAGTCEIN